MMTHAANLILFSIAGAVVGFAVAEAVRVRRTQTRLARRLRDVDGQIDAMLVQDAPSIEAMAELWEQLMSLSRDVDRWRAHPMVVRRRPRCRGVRRVGE